MQTQYLLTQADDILVLPLDLSKPKSFTEAVRTVLAKMGKVLSEKKLCLGRLRRVSHRKLYVNGRIGWKYPGGLRAPSVLKKGDNQNHLSILGAFDTKRNQL